MKINTMMIDDENLKLYFEKTVAKTIVPRVLIGRNENNEKFIICTTNSETPNVEKYAIIKTDKVRLVDFLKDNISIIDILNQSSKTIKFEKNIIDGTYQLDFFSPIELKSELIHSKLSKYTCLNEKEKSEYLNQITKEIIIEDVISEIKNDDKNTLNIERLEDIINFVLNKEGEITVSKISEKFLIGFFNAYYVLSVCSMKNLIVNKYKVKCDCGNVNSEIFEDFNELISKARHGIKCSKCQKSILDKEKYIEWYMNTDKGINDYMSHVVTCFFKNDEYKGPYFLKGVEDSDEY